jgi:hypothetical protein
MRPRIVVAVFVAMIFSGAVVGFSQKPAKLSDFMQLKLKHSQQILEGVAIEDFDMIAKSARDLSLQSMEETWQVFETPEYLQHSDEFKRAADAVAKAAHEKNLDGAALAYVGLTLKCVSCHKYVRDVRMASGGLGLPDSRTGE